MRIAKCELLRLQTPFRRTFKHAAAERSHGDAIIIQIVTENGVHGFGEIQARPYVTGEDNDEIWQTLAAGVAKSIVGRVMTTKQEVYRQLGADAAYQEQPALVGGFDIALLDALELEHGLDWTTIFGPARSAKTEKCLTIGEDYSGDDLRNQARLARLGGYAVVKLKVSGVEDVARIAALRQWIGDDIALRLDANGRLDSSSANDLLKRCVGYDIESIEEPLNKSAPDLVQKLSELRDNTGVALMADESICTEVDLSRFVGQDAYQIVNVRIGKCGGISGAAGVLKSALNSGFSVASGTMVGETSVMLRASRRMLAYCNELKYVEGLDQSKKLMQAQALVSVEGDPIRHFEWVADIARKYVVGSKTAE